SAEAGPARSRSAPGTPPGNRWLLLEDAGRFQGELVGELEELGIQAVVDDHALTASRLHLYGEVRGLAGGTVQTSELHRGLLTMQGASSVPRGPAPLAEPGVLPARVARCPQPVPVLDGAGPWKDIVRSLLPAVFGLAGFFCPQE